MCVVCHGDVQVHVSSQGIKNGARSREKGGTNSYYKKPKTTDGTSVHVSKPYRRKTQIILRALRKSLVEVAEWVWAVRFCLCCTERIV